ncbi:hypothetical protein G9A89_000372, partial [Geosiphon pyriformis]
MDLYYELTLELTCTLRRYTLKLPSARLPAICSIRALAILDRFAYRHRILLRQVPPPLSCAPGAPHNPPPGPYVFGNWYTLNQFGSQWDPGPPTEVQNGDGWTPKSGGILGYGVNTPPFRHNGWMNTRSWFLEFGVWYHLLCVLHCGNGYSYDVGAYYDFSLDWGDCGDHGVLGDIGLVLFFVKSLLSMGIDPGYFLGSFPHTHKGSFGLWGYMQKGDPMGGGGQTHPLPLTKWVVCAIAPATNIPQIPLWVPISPNPWSQIPSTPIWGYNLASYPIARILKAHGAINSLPLCSLCLVMVFVGLWLGLVGVLKDYCSPKYGPLSLMRLTIVLAIFITIDLGGSAYFCIEVQFGSLRRTPTAALLYHTSPYLINPDPLEDCRFILRHMPFSTCLRDICLLDPLIARTGPIASAMLALTRIWIHDERDTGIDILLDPHRRLGALAKPYDHYYGSLYVMRDSCLGDATFPMVSFGLGVVLGGKVGFCLLLGCAALRDSLIPSGKLGYIHYSKAAAWMASQLKPLPPPVGEKLNTPIRICNLVRLWFYECWVVIGVVGFVWLQLVERDLVVGLGYLGDWLGVYGLGVIKLVGLLFGSFVLGSLVIGVTVVVYHEWIGSRYWVVGFGVLVGTPSHPLTSPNLTRGSSPVPITHLNGLAPNLAFLHQYPPAWATYPIPMIAEGYLVDLLVVHSILQWPLCFGLQWLFLSVVTTIGWSGMVWFLKFHKGNGIDKLIHGRVDWGIDWTHGYYRGGYKGVL